MTMDVEQIGQANDLFRLTYDNWELLKWIGLYAVAGLFAIVALLIVLIFFVALRS